MARGNITASITNQGQGENQSIERFAVFIGVAPSNQGIYARINQQSDLDTWLGNDDSDLKTQLEAAKLNAGPDWAAGVVAVADETEIASAIDTAMAATNAAFICVCTPQTSAAGVNDLQAKAQDIFNTLSRPVIIVAATAGIDSASQSWANYTTVQQALTAGVSAYRVALVPQLNGNNLGVVMGRACHSGVSIADSIMRTATGGAVGLGPTPADSTGAPLTEAVLTTLESYRLTVTQTYPDYAGVYFSDFNLLDAQGGDYSVVENLRVVDKAVREIRALLMPKIASRSLNDTETSMQWHRNYLRQPLVAMARKAVVNNQEQPGDIQPPDENAVVIQWTSNTAVSVFVTVKPYNSPKSITVAVGIDLSASA